MTLSLSEFTVLIKCPISVAAETRTMKKSKMFQPFFKYDPGPLKRKPCTIDFIRASVMKIADIICEYFEIISVTSGS
jgi:hypothetical protein